MYKERQKQMFITKMKSFIHFLFINFFHSPMAVLFWCLSKSIFSSFRCIRNFSGEIFESLKSHFPCRSFAGSKNKYLSICIKKLHIIAIVPITGRGGGVNALADCPSKNVFFLTCSLRRAKFQHFDIEDNIIIHELKNQFPSI